MVLLSQQHTQAVSFMWADKGVCGGDPWGEIPAWGSSGNLCEDGTDIPWASVSLSITWSKTNFSGDPGG